MNIETSEEKRLEGKEFLNRRKEIWGKDIIIFVDNKYVYPLELIGGLYALAYPYLNKVKV